MASEERTIKKSELSGIERWLIGFAIGFAIIGFATFIGSIFYFKNGEVFDGSLKINSDKFGDFGSFISGSVGSIWALVSVLLFYVTLRLQRNELALQREELELTRNELKEQKDEMARANVYTVIQQFDNKFFQMITLFNEIRKGISINRAVSDPYYIDETGVQFFHRLSIRIWDSFNSNDSIFYSLPERNLERLNLVYQTFYFYQKSILSHYFINLYNIVKIVDENKLLDLEQKKNYIRIIRAQLSQYELVILAYNGMSEFGKNFYPLINKYELLQNIDLDLMKPINERSNLVYPKIWIEKYDHLNKMYSNKF